MGLGSGMSKRRWALSASVALVAILVAGGAQAQSLSDSVRMTVQTNPKILSQENNRSEVDSEMRRARNLLIAASRRAGNRSAPNTQRISSRRRTATVSISRQELSAVLTQKLYDGGATTAEVDYQLGRTWSAACRIAENAQYIGLDAVEAHLDVVRLRNILALADKNVQAHA